MVSSARKVQGKRDQALYEGYEILPQILRGLGRVITDQLFRRQVKYHLLWPNNYINECKHFTGIPEVKIL